MISKRQLNKLFIFRPFVASSMVFSRTWPCVFQMRRCFSIGGRFRLFVRSFVYLCRLPHLLPVFDSWRYSSLPLCPSWLVGQSIGQLVLWSLKIPFHSGGLQETKCEVTRCYEMFRQEPTDCCLQEEKNEAMISCFLYVCELLQFQKVNSVDLIKYGSKHKPIYLLGNSSCSLLL